ncbi:hypothetical protein HN419_05145 [Candidatus Woesearchaeota archaeon]|jgi:hypothetical protein|nr:hypothetical protein [Candidatus Woesearchaeota archaeon]MBT3537743.1 hypothetical protein [Candidatus Woesearchaeota archaeon]MBT4697874.1 hypothetical protein [Candidatus Woesearchaeota archaeon]MBT4717466.1 hypothetical protein [Candidatus Woesearchaeota archaeon]MBT7105412.1 hypothetical protein [Candidatus Woesearchaeota archaeon]
MKRLFLGIVVVAFILLIALVKVDFFKPTPIQPVCNAPYIHFETDCCLDVNDNAICDSQEEIAKKIDEAEARVSEVKPSENIDPFDAAKASEEILKLSEDFMTYLLDDDYHSLYYLFSEEFKSEVDIDNFVFVLNNIPFMPEVESMYVASLTVRRNEATLTFGGEGSAFMLETFGSTSLAYDDYYGWRFEDFSNYFEQSVSEFCIQYSESSEECMYDYAVLSEYSAMCATLSSLKPKCFYKVALKTEDASLCHKSGEYQQSCLTSLDIPLTLSQRVRFCEDDFNCLLWLAINENDRTVCDSLSNIDAVHRCYGLIAYLADDYQPCIDLGNGKASYYCSIPFIADLDTASANDNSICSRFDATYSAKCQGDVLTHRFTEQNYVGWAYNRESSPSGTKTGKGSGVDIYKKPLR